MKSNGRDCLEAGMRFRSRALFFFSRAGMQFGASVGMPVCHSNDGLEKGSR